MRAARVAAILAFAGALLLVAALLLFDRWLSTPLAVGTEPARIEIPRGQPLAHTAIDLQVWLAQFGHPPSDFLGDRLVSSFLRSRVGILPADS